MVCLAAIGQAGKSLVSGFNTLSQLLSLPAVSKSEYVAIIKTNSSGAGTGFVLYYDPSSSEATNSSIFAPFNGVGRWYKITGISGGSTVTVNEQIFTNSGSGTWTKPSGALFCYVKVIGAGSGGGGGAFDSDRNGAVYGGSGGSGGAVSEATLPASILGSTESVMVGAGGAGGSGVSGPSGYGPGEAGTEGGSSYFGSWVVSKSASASSAGGTGAGSGGDDWDTGDAIQTSIGGIGGSGQYPGGFGQRSYVLAESYLLSVEVSSSYNAGFPLLTVNGASGGGAGGSLTNGLDGIHQQSPSVYAPLSWGAAIKHTTPSGAGSNGTNGASPPSYWFAGMGGTGGNSSTNTAAGSGGNGSYPGGGGGGGGASRSATMGNHQSGGGGSGANGFVGVLTIVSQ